MCNQYVPPESYDEYRQIYDYEAENLTGNEPWFDEAFPDRTAPIVRKAGAGLHLVKARWGMPSPPKYLSKSGRDAGVTNIRNAGSPHWRCWLGPEHRCLVPVKRFAEPGPTGKPVWFESADGTPMMFAGICVDGWVSIRKVRDGETEDDLFGFLTTEPNAEVGAIHPKAMPVILRTREEWDAWLTLPWDEVRHMQRPLPDGALRVKRS